MSDPRSGHAVARGVSQLAFDAVEQLTGIVESMHANIASSPLRLGGGAYGRTRGLTGFVYDSIGVAIQGARAALDRGLGLLPSGPSAVSEALLCALNGVLGDHLAATGNPLAIPMQLRHGEPSAGRHRLLLIHGLCMGDRAWQRNGHDHGEKLARDLGFTPVYLVYNSGRHVSENGRELAALLEALVAEEDAKLTILAHSMGGLVARSACHHAAAAGYAWPTRLSRLVFLGTPHHGAPLERGGSWLEMLLGVSRYSAPLGRLGMLRSGGITDLRYGNVRDEDWRERDRFARGGDCRLATPLPPGVECHALAGGRDALVPVDSALGRHPQSDHSLGLPDPHCWVGERIGHLDLLDDAEVYARLRSILAPSAG